MNLESMRINLVDRVRQLPDAQVLWLHSYLDRMNSFSEPDGNVSPEMYSFDESHALQELRLALLKGEQSGMDINFDGNDFLKSLHKKYVNDQI